MVSGYWYVQLRIKKNCLLGAHWAMYLYLLSNVSAMLTEQYINPSSMYRNYHCYSSRWRITGELLNGYWHIYWMIVGEIDVCKLWNIIGDELLKQVLDGLSKDYHYCWIIIVEGLLLIIKKYDSMCNVSINIFAAWIIKIWMDKVIL